jgi:hypothetical protein
MSTHPLTHNFVYCHLLHLPITIVPTHFQYYHILPAHNRYHAIVVRRLHPSSASLHTYIKLTSLPFISFSLRSHQLFHNITTTTKMVDIDSLLFFFVVFALLGWLACESDAFSPAAGPHPSSSSSVPVASPPASPRLSRRERRALARLPSLPPAHSLPGSLLAPPRSAPPPLAYRHVPATGRHDTFLDVGMEESFGGIERVFNPVNGWK